MSTLCNNDTASTAGLRTAISWSLAILPPLAAVEAFIRTSQERVLSLLLGEGFCGASRMASSDVRIFGHCPDCYVAAAQAGLLMLATILMIDAVSGAGAVRRLASSVRR